MTAGEERSAAKLHPLDEAEKEYQRQQAIFLASQRRAVSRIRLDTIMRRLRAES